MPQKKDAPFFYGGQAVMEGVMMRGKTMYAMAVRKPDGDIEIVKKTLQPAANKWPILKWPIFRGVVSFVDSLTIGVKTLSQSADICGMADDDPNEQPSRFERFLQEKLGDKLNDLIIQASVVFAVLIAVVLFMLLPAVIGNLFTPLLQGRLGLIGVVEGIIRIGIFLAYVYLISFSKDVRRVFQYHGAEHKTINCYEHNEPLQCENIMKYSRLHKRCGTSFLLIVMIISMLVFMFIRTDNIWLRLGSRIVLIPVIAGLSYEIIKWAGRSDNLLVRAVSFPGLCLQRLTTDEPDTAQVEIAIAALEAVLSEQGKQA